MVSGCNTQHTHHSIMQMSTKTRFPLVEVVSPIGVLQWPSFLNEATYMGKSKGYWEVVLRIKEDTPEAIAFMNKLEEYKDYCCEANSNFAAASKNASLFMPIRSATTKVDGNKVPVENAIDVVFRRKCTYFYDGEQHRAERAGLVDVDGNPMSIEGFPELPHESVGRVSGSLLAYSTPTATGIKYLMDAVQIVSLGEGGGRSDARHLLTPIRSDTPLDLPGAPEEEPRRPVELEATRGAGGSADF